MREYGKIKTSFWSNAKVRSVSEGARYLLAYLFACPHGNMVGCFVLPYGYVSEDLGWSVETVSERFSELFQKGFIERDGATRLVRIPAWWEHNNIENTNVGKAAIKLLRSLPACETKIRAIQDLKRFLEQFPETVQKQLSEAFAEPFAERLPELTPTIEPEPEREPEPEQEPETRAARPRPDDAFDRFWKAYPHRGTGSDPRKPAAEKFARLVRDGVDPETIVRAAQGYARAQTGQDPKFNAQALTWLNQARWEQYAAELGPERVAVVSDDVWRDRLAKHPIDRWPAFLGPAPGMPGCKVPSHLLIELFPESAA